MSTLDNIQIIYEVLKKAGNIDAQKALTDLKEQNLKLREENLAFKEQIKELEEKLKIKEQLEFDGRMYWLKNGDTKEGPYCHLCYERDNKLIHLLDASDGFYKCSACDVLYDIRKTGDTFQGFSLE